MNCQACLTPIQISSKWPQVFVNNQNLRTFSFKDLYPISLWRISIGIIHRPWLCKRVYLRKYRKKLSRDNNYREKYFPRKVLSTKSITLKNYPQKVSLSKISRENYHMSKAIISLPSEILYADMGYFFLYCGSIFFMRYFAYYVITRTLQVS